MGKYVKSYSNYVLKTKHQEIDNGVVYERDITTIGGRDRFTKGQVPIYKSGNFVITVNNDSTVYKKTPSHEWKGNDDGDVWTLDVLEKYKKDEKSSYDKKIVIKKDYYDLRDFAYYGSCSELIRTSVNDIIENFPGELFIPIIYTWEYGGNVFYSEEVAKVYSEKNGIPWPWENQPKQNTISVTYSDYAYIDKSKGEDYTSLPVKRNFQLPIDNKSNALLFAIDNPFGINIHSSRLPEGGNPLKYFADGGVNNYVAYYYENGEWNYDNELSISLGEFVQNYDVCFQGVDIVGNECTTDEKVSLTLDPQYSSVYSIGDFLGYRDITIVGKCTFRVYAFIGDDNDIKYFIDGKRDACALNIRIRPKNNIIDDYFDNLDGFEKILVNRSTDYEATFEIINENEYGYFVNTRRYKFPTTYGGYNLGSKSSMFNEYIEGLVNIGEYYDENFTDNLWRSMTHESIKNFDWTYTRHFEPGDEIEYVEGGNKIQKIIRIYGREFDEIRTYIDSISSNNTITYDNINNLPDYFFTDKLEDDGWDVKLVTPLKLTEFVNGTETTEITPSEEPTNKHNGSAIYRVFNEVTDNVKPYTKDKITSLKKPECDKWIHMEIYDSGCTTDEKVDTTFEVKNELENAINLNASSDMCLCNGRIETLSAETGEFQRDGYHDRCCNDIKIYSSEKEYTTADVNSEFMKRFIINSKEILRNKGTINGIEMALSLFGLKSRNYVYSNDTYFRVEQTSNKAELKLTDFGKTYYKKTDLTSAQSFDYDIKEYTLFTTRITDRYIPSKKMYEMDWVNSLKLITHNTPGNKQGGYVSYQGLPVAYRLNPSDRSDNPERFLYPSFQNYLPYDGGLYYQMNGGWLSKKPFMFDTKNNIIPIDYKSENSRNSVLFTETVKNIKSVQTLDELLSNKSLATMTGDICQVIDLSGSYAVIDGLVYKLLNEEGFKYFYATITNNSLSVGNALFTGFVYVSNPFADNNLLKINLDDDSYNGKNIKIYVINNDVDVHSNTNSISTFTLFENGKYMQGNNFTNYFRINNPDFSNELSVIGWQQLRDDEYEYYIMDAITDYNKGNNPHTGHMNYDNGHEYLAHFSHLFKTVYENSLFDTSLVDEYDVDVYSKSYDYGFSNLVDEDDCIKNYDNNLQEDIKCHYFGDYFTTNGTLNKYSLDNSVCMTSTIRKTVLGVGKLKQMHYGEGVSTNIDGVTNQIVNTKRVDIDFYLNSDVEYSKEWLEEVKYIDSVILPYLTQVVPSTIILAINYKKKSDKVCTPST